MSKGSTTTTTEMPEWQQQQYQDIYRQAQSLAGQPFIPYTGAQVAGFSPDELRAFEAQRGRFAQSQQFDPFAARAKLMREGAPQIEQVGGQAAQIGMVPTYTGAQIGPVSGPTAAQIAAPRQLQVQSLLDTDISAYRSPFEQQVVDVALGDIQRQQDIAQQRAQEQAVRAGAFGGSRGAILEAEAARPFAEEAARTAAQLRQAGFQQAQRAAESDIQRSLAAQQFGIGLESDIARRQAELQQQAGLAGFEGEQQRALEQARLQQQAGILGSEQAQQRALEQARLQQQFGLAGMDINARRALEQARMQQAQQQFQAGLIGQQELGQQQALSGLLGQGAQQRGLEQQALGAAYGEFQRALQYPFQQFGFLSQALSGVPAQSQTYQQSKPGSLDYLSGLTGLLGLFYSDARLKDNIELIGQENGFNVYQWDWNDKAKELGVNQPNVGLIAQEIQETNPEAVVKHDSGYLMINYGALA